MYNDIKHHRVKQARQKLAQLKGWPTKQLNEYFVFKLLMMQYEIIKLERSLKPATPFTHAGLNHYNYLKKSVII